MSVDRIFLDANILFSMAYGSPSLEHLWELAREKRCVLLASNYVIEEARRNLPSGEQIKRLEIFLSVVHIVPEVDPEIPCPIELPHKDWPVLLAAMSAKADYLLTGDMMHFGKYLRQTISGVNICLPRDYLTHLHKKRVR